MKFIGLRFDTPYLMEMASYLLETLEKNRWTIFWNLRLYPSVTIYLKLKNYDFQLFNYSLHYAFLEEQKIIRQCLGYLSCNY